MKTLLSVACVAALCLGVSITPAVGQEADGPSYTLGCKFKPGETLRYELKHESTQTMDVGMGPMKTTMVNTTIMADTCREVGDDGSVVLASKTESIAMKLESPMMNFEYDSAKPNADALKQAPMFRFMFALAGETLTFTLSPERKVTKVEGLKELRERLEKDASDEELESLREALDEKQISRNIEAIYAAWPAKPVAVGGTWASSMNMPASEAGSFKADLTHKLAGVEKHDGVQVALVETSGTLEFVPGDMQMKATSQKFEGRAALDMDKGEVIETTANITMDLSMEGMPGTIKTTTVHTHKRLPTKTAEAEDSTDK